MSAAQEHSKRVFSKDMQGSLYIIYLNQFLKSVLAGNPPNVWTDCYLHVLAFSEVKPSWFTVFSLICT